MSYTNFHTAEGINSIRNRSFIDLMMVDGVGIAHELAILYLAASLGFIPPRCDNWKDVVNVQSPVRRLLEDTLSQLVTSGVLKCDGERNLYHPINLETARMIEVIPLNVPSSSTIEQLSEFAGKMLIWDCDLFFNTYEASFTGIDGRRMAFVTIPFWDVKYPVVRLA